MTVFDRDHHNPEASAANRGRGRPKSTAHGNPPSGGVASLSRGLVILGALAASTTPLGNGELAQLTGLPKATVSRLTRTLVHSQFLDHDGRTGRYALGVEALSLGYAALRSLDIRRVARPLMQTLAEAAGYNVGLALRNRQWMVYTDTMDGGSVVNLRLVPGSRVPIATSAIGRAYLAALPDASREALLAELGPIHAQDWPELRRKVDAALGDYLRLGFCTSIGDWQRDISAVAAPISVLQGQGPYALNLGGPSYLLPEERLRTEFGPMLAAAASQIRARMS